MKRKYYAAIILFILLLSAATYNIIFSVWYYSEIKELLRTNAPEEKVDAAVIFFHSFGNFHRVDEVTLKRLDAAIELYQQGLTENFICVGGNGGPRQMWGSKKMKNYLVFRGIKADNIFIDSLSVNSITNWQEAEKIAKQKSWTNIALVSSAAHLPRLFNIASASRMEISIWPPGGFEFEEKAGSKELWFSIQHELVSSTGRMILGDSLFTRIVLYFRT